MVSIFTRGLLAVAPIALTIAVIIWVIGILERAFSIPIIYVLGADAYFTGMGILAATVFILIVGVMINNWLIQAVYSFGEATLKRIPLVKTLYNAISDFLGFLRSTGEGQANKVVVVEFEGVRLLGLVTREAFDGLPDGFGGSGDIAVFLPLSYQIGGFTVVMPASKVQPIDMTVEAAMRFAATAGVPGNKVAAK